MASCFTRPATPQPPLLERWLELYAKPARPLVRGRRLAKTPAIRKEFSVHFEPGSGICALKGPTQGVFLCWGLRETRVLLKEQSCHNRAALHTFLVVSFRASSGFCRGIYLTKCSTLASTIKGERLKTRKAVFESSSGMLTQP